MNYLDTVLNRTTMYRLTLAVLATLVGISLVLAFFHLLPFTALTLGISFIVLLFTARTANGLFALITKAAPTPESAYITALILFFILSPIASAQDVLLLMLAATIAMLSKYVFARNKKHIFNPAAFGALALSVAGSGIATWWVATPILLPFVLVGGLLIVRKMRRVQLFATFVIVATVVFLVRAYLTGSAPLPSFSLFVFSFPVFFFACFMLTEPQTMPAKRVDQTIFGVIVGILFSLSFVLGPLTATPELALLIGNLYTFAVTFRRRVTFTLAKIAPLTRDIVEFTFTPDAPFAYAPGQYMEWTLPHPRSDTRGIRRYVTISSTPSDPYVRIGMRVPVEGSTFKRALGNLTIGETIQATGLGGDFILPTDPTLPIAAIAGGIGITPFMSMFRTIASKRERRDLVLIYSAASPADFAYQEELDALAPSIGLTVFYLPTDFTEVTGWEGESGYVTDQYVRAHIPDFKKRTWYLSGPNPMVAAYKKLLQSHLSIEGNTIQTDYFPGL